MTCANCNGEGGTGWEDANGRFHFDNCPYCAHLTQPAEVSEILARELDICIAGIDPGIAAGCAPEIAYARVGKLVANHWRTISDALRPTQPADEDADTLVGKEVRHKKRGTLYKIEGLGFAQGEITDEDLIVIYRGKDDGQLWARKWSEFTDGRFEPADPEIADAIRNLKARSGGDG